MSQSKNNLINLPCANRLKQSEIRVRSTVNDSVKRGSGQRETLNSVPFQEKHDWKEVRRPGPF